MSVDAAKQFEEKICMSNASMNNARLYQVLKGPVFSEKSQLLGDTPVFKLR